VATAEAKIHLSEFINEPFVDFSRPENRKAMEDALREVASEFGREYPMYIGGQKVITTAKRTSANPSHPSQVLGVFQEAAADHANQAVEAAYKAFDSWKQVPAEKRVEILLRASDIIRKRKFEVSAWICYEVGKSWAEADADTAETIDFLEFYCREMLRLAGPHPVVPMKGEKNYLKYISLGVGAVIPPWNFPAAIAAGMTAAALVTGNTVVLKPSEESPLVAAKVVEFSYRSWRNRRRRARQKSQDSFHRFYGLQGSRPAHQ
jgi:1-pyrroline-5-carboxylate dehydrogenase